MDTKVCKQCEVEKELNEFYVDRSMKDNHQNKCKACVLENKEKYYQENREERKEYQRGYNKKTKQAKAEYNKKYYMKNRYKTK